MSDYCEYCHDGDGHSVFPYYGLAPHTQDRRGQNSVTLPSFMWPDNFVEDKDARGHGVYVYCLKCGAGK